VWERVYVLLVVSVTLVGDKR